MHINLKKHTSYEPFTMFLDKNVTNVEIFYLNLSHVKKVFLKAHLRIQAFREALPDCPLPPEPVLTRLGSLQGENVENI